ncbi:hypothetical protein AAFP35_24320 [Gordonia sp. CPCC 206044]|uniref:hypothetical protein n=1 Tax=Gordonia sp. CPCC 206044 TaxID=3140793 RepID=UPI003AF3784E
MSDDFDITVPDGSTIPAVTDDPSFQLDELNTIANPLGHSVTHDGKFFRVRPTGAVESHNCLCVSATAEEVVQYLRQRASNQVWNLDMQDPETNVQPVHEGINAAVRITNTATGQAKIVDGGVCGESRRGIVSSFYVRTDAPPAIGRWYR